MFLTCVGAKVNQTSWLQHPERVSYTCGTLAINFPGYGGRRELGTEVEHVLRDSINFAGACGGVQGSRKA